MLRRIVGSAVLVAALQVFPALADDASEGRRPFNWTGFYVGGHGGTAVGFSNTKQDFQSAGANDPYLLAPFQLGDRQALVSQDYQSVYSYLLECGTCVATANYTPATAPTQFDDSGKVLAAYGAEASYLWQRGNFVAGVAADITFLQKQKANSWESTGNGSGAIYYPEDPPVAFSSTQLAWGSARVGVDWLSTLRLSAGAAGERSLFYVTGGLAVGRVTAEASARLGEAITAISGSGDYLEFQGLAQWQAKKEEYRVGYSVGTGMNYAITDNIIFKAETLYYNLGTEKLSAPGQFSAVGGGMEPHDGSTGPLEVTRKLDGVIAKTGIAVKF